jgi:four helix bundle protein
VDKNAIEQLKQRTKKFALRIIRLYEALPHNGVAYVLGKQLLRSGTSVGANYRAVCRSRSDAEFVAKMGVVVEEADESLYWLELLGEAGILPPRRLSSLLREAGELVRIFATARQTARARLRPSTNQPFNP